MFTGETKRCSCCEVERPLAMFHPKCDHRPGRRDAARRPACRGCYSGGDSKPLTMKARGAPLSEIQARSNASCDRIRVRLGLPEFSFGDHVAHKSHADRIKLTAKQRSEILRAEWKRAEDRHSAANSRPRLPRIAGERRRLSDEERALRKQERARRLSERASRMGAADLLREAARRQIRAVTAPTQRVLVNNRAYAKGVPAVKPKPPSRKKDWTLTISQRFELLRKQDGRCSATGIRFEVMGEDWWRSRHPLSPSLDRVNNDLGYTFENARLVCLLWNLGKSTHTEQAAREAFLAISEAIRTTSIGSEP